MVVDNDDSFLPETPISGRGTGKRRAPNKQTKTKEKKRKNQKMSPLRPRGEEKKSNGALNDAHVCEVARPAADPVVWHGLLTTWSSEDRSQGEPSSSSAAEATPSSLS